MKRLRQVTVVAALVVIMAGLPSAGYTTPSAMKMAPNAKFATRQPSYYEFHFHPSWCGPAAWRATTNAVREWNITALGVIAADKENPPASIRTIAMVHVGIYDAVQAILTASNSHPLALNGAVLDHVSPHASLDAAVAAAARSVLLGLVPGQAPAIEAAYASALAQIPDSHDKDEGIRVGSWVGNTVVVARSGDGANLAVPYTQLPGIGVFQPVPPATAIGTQWPRVRPVLLRSASQFRPGPPPALTSAQYAADYNEIKSLGAANSTTRTPDQTQIGLFWLDEDGYEWNTVARTVAAEKGTTLVQDARMFALLNVAMLMGSTPCSMPNTRTTSGDRRRLSVPAMRMATQTPREILRGPRSGPLPPTPTIRRRIRRLRVPRRRSWHRSSATPPASASASRPGQHQMVPCAPTPASRKQPRKTRRPGSTWGFTSGIPSTPG